MSSIGPGSIGGINLVSSIAGSQRTNSDSDRLKESSADRKAVSDQKAISAHTAEDVAEAELSADRDADGRQSYSAPDDIDEHPSDSVAKRSDEPAHEPIPDAFGERGGRLDLEG